MRGEQHLCGPIQWRSLEEGEREEKYGTLPRGYMLLSSLKNKQKILYNNFLRPPCSDIQIPALRRGGAHKNKFSEVFS